MIRSGIGYDIHRFAKGRKLILGGVEIPHLHGLEGHSDADVLSHAIGDALLGAIGAGDIGEHFPNTDESIRGISSIEILKRVAKMLAEKNARVLNFDRARISIEESKDIESAEGMTELLLDLPSRVVTFELRRLRHENPQTVWERSDLEDMAAMAIATVEVVGRDRRTRRKSSGRPVRPSLPG